VSSKSGPRQAVGRPYLVSTGATQVPVVVGITEYAVEVGPVEVGLSPLELSPLEPSPLAPQPPFPEVVDPVTPGPAGADTVGDT
jgi:hypothetical protein